MIMSSLRLDARQIPFRRDQPTENAFALSGSFFEPDGRDTALFEMDLFQVGAEQPAEEEGKVGIVADDGNRPDAELCEELGEFPPPQRSRREQVAELHGAAGPGVEHALRRLTRAD